MTLIALELALRLVGWSTLILRQHQASAQTSQSGSVRMLHLGESTTFGLGVKPGEAYPAVLAEILKKRHPSQEFISINRGVPGLVTSAMERSLDEKLTVERPKLVSIMAGANDFNEELNGLQPRNGVWLPESLVRFASGLRIYKTLWLASELMRPDVSLDHGEVIYYHHGGSKNVLYETTKDDAKIAEVTVQLEANLRQMIAECRKAGAVVVVVGYIQAFEENKILLHVANEMGVPYVSTYLEPNARPRSLFTDDGWHPSASGHRHIAERLADVVEPLIESGL